MRLALGRLPERPDKKYEMFWGLFTDRQENIEKTGISDL
jgi:hypothetical protein